ncbi:metallophosphoesterase family protein [Algoriphagus resistens]|uniref:metallophosphoesterase family protein n=1 Tax=Algoriphagus resistens TaxID=1750590 RepID=UPI000716C59B|nr:metallophosphoesterase family protein [Algoriphagus resistens]
MPTKIALISDSHSYIDHKTLAYLEEVDEIWHAGDIGSFAVMEDLPIGKPIRAVYGNIDDMQMQQAYPEWQEFTLEGVKVLMTHIGGKPPRYAKGIKSKIKESAPDLFICGHSHICKVEFDKTANCLYMNPGAIGQSGFHVIRTMLLFELEAGQLRNLSVVELGKRGKVL